VSSVRRLSEDWDELAEEDALWAILAEPGRDERRWELDAFLATGEQEVAAVLATAERLGHPSRHERALDFGCGVGRLTRALASRFDECVGVDVSPEMVRRARELNVDTPNCSFVVNVEPHLRQFPDASFDFVYSSKVLQHMPSSELACEYVREFLRIVRDDGLVVFQLWTRIPLRNRVQPRRRAYGALRAARLPVALLRRLGLSPMGRGIAVPLTEVRALVAERGHEVAKLEPDGEWGYRFFVVRASA
jgi:SAM-dependent methyltransferase